MTLQEFLTDLEITTLSGINLGTNRSAGISKNNHPEIIALLNTATRHIHTEFPSNRNQDLIIKLVPGKHRYVIDPAYAITNNQNSEPEHYIQDTEEFPFNKPVTKIIAVYDMKGEKLAVNNSRDAESIRTLDFKTLYFPEIKEEEDTFRIVVQVGPSVLVSDGETYLQQEVDLPIFTFYLAKLFITAHLLMNRKTGESEMESNKYLSMYERELLRLKNNGYEHTDDTVNHKLHYRGFP